MAYIFDVVWRRHPAHEQLDLQWLQASVVRPADAAARRITSDSSLAKELHQAAQQQQPERPEAVDRGGLGEGGQPRAGAKAGANKKKGRAKKW